jgi:hypothetical protein
VAKEGRRAGSRCALGFWKGAALTVVCGIVFGGACTLQLPGL